MSNLSLINVREDNDCRSIGRLRCKPARSKLETKVLHAAKRCVLDTLAAIICGSVNPPATLMTEALEEELVKLKGDEAKTYKLTKSLAIKYCREMIKPYEKWTNKINSFKKKDDLADCFLQGMYFISN